MAGDHLNDFRRMGHYRPVRQLGIMCRVPKWQVRRHLGQFGDGWRRAA